MCDPVFFCESLQRVAGMDLVYMWFCGLCVVSLSLYAKPFTTVQYKSTKALLAENRSARPARNETVEARGSNRSRAAKEPHELNANAKGPKQRPASGDQPNSRKKQPPKNREKRKNCFGFKMDRISDISGMGCKND